MGKLAINGGTPAVAPGSIEERWPIVSEEDISAVTETLRSGRLSWINTDAVPALEAAWAAYTGARHCIAVNSGTAALHAAVAAAGIEPGDEVLVPALSFLASAVAVLHHQGIPVFVDVDPETFNIDPAALEQKVSERTRAIVAVHLHGLPADMDPILEVARRHGLRVIEDAAQAPGARYRDRAIGSIGDMGAFSIMAGKNLPTAGEGGLFTTSDPELRDRADSVKMFGERVRPGEPRAYNALTLGWNYRLSPVLASFTLSQMKHLDENTRRVQKAGERLSEALAEIPGLVPPRVPEDRTHVYHLYRFKVDPEAAGLDLDTGVFRKALQDAVTAEGVPLIEYQNRPLPGQTIFQEKVGYGQGCPWACTRPPRGGSGGNPQVSRDVSYDIHDYPRTLEVIRGSLLIGKRLCMASFLEPRNIELYAEAFRKVFENLDELVDHAGRLDYHDPWEEAVRLW